MLFNRLSIEYLEFDSKYYIAYYNRPANMARIAIQYNCKVEDVLNCLQQFTTQLSFGTYFFKTKEDIETFFTMLTIFSATS